MIRKTRIFTPGPTALLPQAQAAMAAAGMHHRTAEFRELFSRVIADLQTFIGSRNEVIVLAASGTGAMEAAVTNLTSPGDRVLVLSAGKFGERWRDLARAFGCSVEMVIAEYGQTFSADMSDIAAKLTPETRCVYMQATESSTGARHNVEAVASLLRSKRSDALLVVDAITGLGTTRFDVDGWGIDVIIGGSQKAVMVQPGIAFCAVSERAWARMASATTPRYYFDLRKERKANANGESAYTPAIGLIAALGAALDFLRQQGEGDLARGRDALIANAETAAAMTRAAAVALKLQLFAASAPAAALTAIIPPEGLDSSAIVKAFRQEFAAVIANGQGEMKGKLFRVAHLGYYDYLDTLSVIGALEQVLSQFKPGHSEFGVGLAAAQMAYSAARAAVAR